MIEDIFARKTQTLLIVVQSVTGKGTQKKKSYNLRPAATWLQESPEAKQHDESTTNSKLQFFDLKTMATATNNFSFENKLGRGGFGSVFKVVTSESFSYV